MGKAVYSQHELSRQMPIGFTEEKLNPEIPVPCLRPWMSLTEVMGRAKSGRMGSES